MREPWINPAKADNCGLENTKRLLGEAQKFHQKLKDTFHPFSYAHYGCDREQQAYQTVTWRLFDPSKASQALDGQSTQGSQRSRTVSPDSSRNPPFRVSPDNIDALRIAYDNKQGIIRLTSDPNARELTVLRNELEIRSVSNLMQASIMPASEPGDKTVPMHSAEYLATHGGKNFKGIFRQTGYEHQESYMNERAIAATLYSIVRIAQQMKWETP